MSSNSFDKKIKDKLYEHESNYDSGAWEKFKPMLPVPWYASLFQNYGGWLFGGLATSALLFTFFYQNNKNNLLNEEISTLKQQLATISETDTVFIQKNIVDTVYRTEYIEKYKYITIPNNQIEPKAQVQKEPSQPNENPLKGETIEQNLAKVENKDSKSDNNKPAQSSNDFITKNYTQGTKIEKDQIDESSVVQREKTMLPKEANSPTNATTLTDENQLAPKSENESLTSQNGEINSIAKSETSAPETEAKSDENTGLIEDEPSVSDDPLKDTPNKPKKKINLPKMRLGIGSDYLGLNILTNGLNAEVFIADKLSLSTGILFSGIRKTEHTLAKDFNSKTGKQFQKEFEKYNPRIKEERPDQIRDINIRTSFIKMPINFNYYINTWSRFNFMISAGTHLDLRVYQDIDYFSGPIGNLIKDRFEAKPSPKVLNSFNYGMGIQYKYGRIVGQLMPYFDFRFRNTDYFSPKNKFGLSAALKYELGK